MTSNKLYIPDTGLENDQGGFCNPESPPSECLCAYAHCLIIGPLQGIFCLPFACCAQAHKNHQKERDRNEKRHREEEKAAGETVNDPPARQVDMSTLPDASKPRSEWPANWRESEKATTGTENQGEGGRAISDGNEDEARKGKSTNDGVLKLATA
ncbi:hypothetical protein F5Y16DRAFT_321620 [Xylariaceae sp. FL0255]|nr:hypothetical protein F5Y16DRAFT_321620 [Xylariaceae sp. FL0255]